MPGAGFPPQGIQSFAWPLKGQVVISFGEKEEKVSAKGIVIRPREGGLVLAARDGRVSFVDERLKGYGRTVIIEHTLEFSTVYARNSEILVKSGQWVLQGEPIARVGDKGKNAVPQLYFEVRRNARAEDPLLYLPRKNF